jgi:hypothetical protein
MLVMRTAVHRSTKFTPFQLMFGRPWNPLRDFHQLVIHWEIDPAGERADVDEEIVAAVASRARLMRQQLDWAEASENMEKAQTQHRAAQDGSHEHAVIHQRLAIGDRVWVVKEQRGHKLDHHFRGPYRIVAHASEEIGANYILEDLFSGATLGRSVPRDKIFLSVNVPLTQRQKSLFAEEEIDAAGVRLDNVHPGPLPPCATANEGHMASDSWAIHSFLDVRSKGRRREFLVKWEGYEEPSWEPADGFEAPVAAELERKMRRALSAAGPGRSRK